MSLPGVDARSAPRRVTPNERTTRERRAQELERRFEMPMLVAALLTIPALALETQPTGSLWREIARALNWLVWGAFVVELGVMLRVVPSRSQWLVRHPLELGVVLFTAPFLPAPLQATRVFRLLRLVRLVAAVKFAW